MSDRAKSHEDILKDIQSIREMADKHDEHLDKVDACLDRLELQIKLQVKRAIKDNLCETCNDPIDEDDRCCDDNVLCRFCSFDLYKDCNGCGCQICNKCSYSRDCNYVCEKCA